MSFIDRYERTLIDGARRAAEAPPTPSAAGPSAARRARWRRPAVWGGGLAFAAAATAAMLAIPSGSQLSPIEEARAALTPGPAIIHFKIRPILEAPSEYPLPSCMPAEPSEIWQTTTAPVRAKLIGGRPAATEDCPGGTMPDDTALTSSMQQVVVSTQGGASGGAQLFYSPDLNHAVRVTEVGDPIRAVDLTAPLEGFASSEVSDPQVSLRRMLTSPELQYVGKSAVAGGAEERIFVLPEPAREGDDPDRPKNGTLTYVVDAQTYAPKRVELRQRVNVASSGNPADYQPFMNGMVFDLWERLPLDAEHEQLLEIDLPDDATVVTGTPKEIYQDLTRAERLARVKAGKARLEAYLAKQRAEGRTP